MERQELQSIWNFQHDSKYHICDLDDKECSLYGIIHTWNQIMKILLVDDNKDITKMLHKYMTLKGHSCDVANDGQSGLDFMNNQIYDVVILDIAMPKFSGNDVLDELEKNGRIKQQHIVTLTASVLSVNHETTLKSKGVHSCLKKPIDPDVLLAHLQQFENKKTV